MGVGDKLRQFNADKLNKEKEAGMDFLKVNAAKEGVQELNNGIQYLVLQEGNGEKPSPKATIRAHYAGRLLSGKEFDNSFKRGQPFSAPLTALIKGWQHVLPMMPVGSKWRLWIPSDLAYGDNGVGQAGIPGGAVLEFDIELLKILK
jgi:FKBP-type peptidyl-prolyl cis-trans isomerase FklB